MADENDTTIDPVPLTPGHADSVIANRLADWTRDHYGEPGYACPHEPLTSTGTVTVLAWDLMVRCQDCTVAFLAASPEGQDPAGDLCDVCGKQEPGVPVYLRTMHLKGAAALIVKANGPDAGFKGSAVIHPPMMIIYGVCDGCAAL
jgi:hypothetical protein